MANPITFEDYFPTSDKTYPFIPHAHSYDTINFKSAINAAIQDSGGQTYNVKSYGAKGDGVTDDTAAFNTTISTANAAGGGRVFVPPGNYIINSNITMLSNVILEGSGFASKLTIANQKDISIIGQQYVAVRDLYLEMNAGNTNRNQFAIFMDQTSDVYIERCYILNAYGYGIFVSNSAAGTTVSRFHFLNNRITGKCTNDLIGGGPNTATSNVTDICVQGNFLMQDTTLTGAGSYFGCIDIVAQNKSTIMNNIVYGSIACGGESIPNVNVNILGNVLMPANGAASNLAVGRILVLAGSLYGQSASDSSINVIGNNLTSGTIFVQGQSSTSNRTQKVIVADNNIVGSKTQTFTQDNYGIYLAYVANINCHDNIVDGSSIGINLSDVQEANVSDNKILNCTTNISRTSVANLSGRNNLGVNPEFLSAGGNITGATTFARSNGWHQTFTLTGNITVTLNSSDFTGDTMTLELTQDGTGNRTATWPANFKKAGGTLTLTTTANATDVITMRWDGTNWIETGRSLNIS